MITYEQQKKILRKIKQQPDVKKLNRKAIILQTFGWIFLELWFLGVILLLIGVSFAKKRDERINQILPIELAKEENAGEKSRIFEEEKQGERVERFISLSKKRDTINCLLFSIITLTCVLVFFLPVGKILGLESVSAFGTLKELIAGLKVQDGILEDSNGLSATEIFSGRDFEISLLPFMPIVVIAIIFLILSMVALINCLWARRKR